MVSDCRMLHFPGNPQLAFAVVGTKTSKDLTKSPRLHRRRFVGLKQRRPARDRPLRQAPHRPENRAPYGVRDLVAKSYARVAPGCHEQHNRRQDGEDNGAREVPR